jgi:arylformamidase
MRYIDITKPITENMPAWPGQPEIEIYKVESIDKGDVANVTAFKMSGHTGTHIDACNHFLKDAEAVHELPLEATMGRARVIEIKDPESIKVKELEPHHIQKGERILFKTQNSQKNWESMPFIEDYVYISTEAAEYLAEKQIFTVGVDYLSVGGYEKNTEEVHKALFHGGVRIIEGLDLKDAPPGEYDLICLPIKVQGADGVPCRAILATRD